MPRFFGTPRQVGLLVAGTVLMLTVSLATAAIVMWLPDSPVYVAPARGERMAQNLREYVQLHQARNAVVPNYMPIAVASSAQ